MVGASARYVLGLEGASEGSTGLPPELFVELLDVLVPKWDLARKDEPLGRYYERSRERESEEDDEDSGSDEDEED